MKNKLTSTTGALYAARLALLLVAMTLSTLWTHARPAPPPMAYFTESPQTGCAPLLVHFYNASGAGAYLWNFGDPGSGLNDTSTACGPFHIFNTPGAFTVTLTVTNGSGVFTHTEAITVLPTPNPLITGPHKACQGPLYSYTYSVPLNAGSTYNWIVNNGAYSTNATGNVITVDWLNYGTNNITVSETNSVGCTGTDTINVNVAPLPNLSNYLPCGQKGGASGRNPDQGNPSQTPCVCANSVQTYFAPGDGNFYKWYVTNGTIVSLGPNGNTATIKWGNSGVACLTLIDSNVFGCKDSATCCFQLCPGPKAKFTITSSPSCLGTSIEFNGSPSAGAISYSWDFGDGSTATGKIVNHTYGAVGSYSVTLTVANSTGCVSDTTMTVTVTPGTAPHIYCPGSVCANSQAVYWTNRIAGATYTWNVTGGTWVPNAVGDSIRVTWGPGPIGMITLSVSGTSIYTCPQPVTVSVPILPAVPAIDGSTVVCIGTQYTYTAPLIPGSDYTWTVTGASLVTPNGNSVNIIWDGTATGTITLHIKNDLLCCKGVNSITVVKKPTLFIFGTNPVCPHQLGTYSTTGGILCNWTVTGGSFVGPSSGVTGVTIKWGTGATGLVTASPVVSGAFCNDPASLSITIIPLPAPAQISGSNMVCLGSTTGYTVNVPPGIGSTWQAYGGSLSSTTPTSTNVTWTVPGMDSIVVIQTNSLGCPVRNKYIVYVVPPGIPTITGPTPVCVHDIKTYSFVLPAGIPASAYQWSVIGGNVTPSAPSNTVTIAWGFSASGVITLTNLVCNTSANFNVTIYDSPTVVINQTLNCNPVMNLTAITDPLSTIQWTGHPVGMATITVSAPGTYTVTVKNPVGCTNVKSITLSSIPTLPHPDATITKTGLYSPTYPFLVEFCVPNVPGQIYHWSSGETTPCIFVHDYIARTVTVTGVNLCTSTNKDSVIYINPCPVPPCPIACSITTNCPVTTLTAGSGSSWSWTLPGGGTASTQSVSVSAGPGTYTVSYLDVSGNPQSCSYTYYGPNPTPTFSVASICNPVTFNNTTFPTANYYYWDYGDGSYSNGTFGQHTYSLAGPYTVVLWVSMDPVGHPSPFR